MLNNPDDELDAATDGIVLVPLWKHQDGTTATRSGTQVDLDADELHSTTTRELAASAIHLTTGEDFSAETLVTLTEIPIPGCFTRSGWLADHHPLILHNGHRTIGPLTFHIDADNEINLAEAAGDDASEDRRKHQHGPRP